MLSRQVVNKSKRHFATVSRMTVNPAKQAFEQNTKKVFESSKQTLKEAKTFAKETENPESMPGEKYIKKFANACGLAGIVAGGVAGPYLEYTSDKKHYRAQTAIEILAKSIYTVPKGMVFGGAIGWGGAGIAGYTLSLTYALSPILPWFVAGCGGTALFALPTVMYVKLSDDKN